MITSIPPTVGAWTGLETPTATRPGAGGVGEAGATGAAEFSGKLTDAVQAVEASQAEADRAIYAVGSGEHDYAQMMISLEEANISLRAMGSVRDKFVEAYQAIWNMPV